jgi:menaquinone reductase, molybdopterin-binding-like subunit
MKIDRRSFLSFVVGGAAGTALSPLPWKLTDNISIWTQMWPWTPVPERGEVTTVASTCTLCPGGCGIRVRKVGDRVVKIEGCEGHPINDGKLCNLGLSGAQLLYGPRRVAGPMKKVDGRFRRVSWEDALAEISAKLGDLREAGHAHRVACIADSDRGTLPEMLSRFLTVYGSPQFFRMPSMLDAYEITLNLTQGVQATPGFDIDNADYVLSFGSGVLDGWGSPLHLFQAHSRMLDRGARLVQIEPRLSSSAAKSQRWIAVNPGTEGVLALGMAHLILKGSLYHSDFAERYAEGFATFKRQVLDGFSPEIVSSVTGVEAAVIQQLAGEFAGARRPLAICGRGKGTVPGSLKESLAVHALNALVGAIGREGGVWAIPEPEYIDWPEPEMDALAVAGMQQGRIDQAGSGKYPHARYLLHRLPEVVVAGGDPSIQVLFVSEANPCHSMPDNRAFSDAVKKIPMVVSFSSFWDETAHLADFVLPNPIYLERFGDVSVTSGFHRPFIGLTRPVVKPLHDTLPTGDVVIRLAQALGGSVAAAFPWKSHAACLKESLADKWDALVEQGYWMDEKFGPRQWTAGFETASGRFEFANAAIDFLTSFSPLKAEGDEAAFPLVLIPVEGMRLWSGYIASPQYVVKAVDDTVLKGNDLLVEVNPETARAAGLKEGSGALLETPRARARVRVHLYAGIMPGLVGMPKGLGHSAFEPNLAGKGVNYNEMVAAVEDPDTGLNAAWGIRAKLTKA